MSEPAEIQPIKYGHSETSEDDALATPVPPREDVVVISEGRSVWEMGRGGRDGRGSGIENRITMNPGRGAICLPWGCGVTPLLFSISADL